MSQTLDLKAKGLYTFPSELSEVPQGALSLANNVNIDKESIITPRRGVENETYPLSSSSDRVDRVFEYQDTKIIQYNGTTLARDTGTSYVNYSGTYLSPESGVPIRAVRSNQNLYLTTIAGLYKLDSITSTPKKAGAPRGLTIELAPVGSGGFLDGVGGDSVAYRCIWGYYDVNDNLILGAPSQRAVVASGPAAASTKDVTVTLTIPDGVTTSYIYQVYRSSNTGGATIEPSDEMQLVYESSPTSSQLTAGVLSFIDSTPEDLRGVTLYTSPSQETIAQANNEPPFARDVAVYKNHLFFADTRQKQKLQLALLAANGTATSPDISLKYDDVITINGVAYTGKASTTVASNQFKVFHGGTPSQDIRDTAAELCRVINQSASNTGANAVYAYYVSGAEETPGKILIESRSVGGAQYTATFAPVVTGANPWQPELPTSGTSVFSTNDSFSNGLYYSKPQEPEAVPEANVFRIGSADDRIKRILALRDSLFILKDDEGVFRLTGEDASSFRVEQFDQTAKIRAPETAVVLSNAIYALTDQGVVQITETGVSVISRPIEDQILDLFSYGRSVVAEYSYGIAYETERKYILATVDSSSDTAADQYFVYNTFTRAWTKWNGFSTKHGIVNTTDDKLYFADNDSHYVLRERKTNTNFDYADFRAVTTISDVSLDGLTLTLLNTDLMSVGDVIYQSATEFSLIESLDTVAGTVTLGYDGGLSAGAATVFGAIPVHIRWVPIHGGNPGILKHFREVTYLFRRNFSISAKAEFFSEISQVVEEVDLAGPTNGLFGFFVFGGIAFGGEIGRSPTRTYVPQQKQRCTQLNVGFIHAVGFSDFQLNGLSTIYNEMSERVAR